MCPSAANGLVGIKPTLGLVSRSGIIPLAHSQDTAGPMARTVTDAAILLSVMVGADPNDAVTVSVREFFEETTQSIFGANFWTFSLLDLLEANEQKEYLVQAEASYEAEEYPACLIAC